MRALTPGLDWPGMLRDVTREGGACAAQAVTGAFLDQLRAELRHVPFRPVDAVVGPVRQEADSFEIRAPELAGYPSLAGLCDELMVQVHEHGVPEWVPNEVAVQRYRPGSLGITPHRDQRRFAQLVAVITLTGAALFTLCRNRGGDPIRRWVAGPGSLVLLRGPGLAGEADGRPMHSVGGPTGGRHRTSLGLRMDTARPTPNPGEA